MGKHPAIQEMVDNVEESSFISMETYPNRFKKVSVQIKIHFVKKCFFQTQNVFFLPRNGPVKLSNMFFM
jgi:hypothetical protein